LRVSLSDTTYEFLPNSRMLDGSDRITPAEDWKPYGFDPEGEVFKGHSYRLTSYQ